MKHLNLVTIVDDKVPQCELGDDDMPSHMTDHHCYDSRQCFYKVAINNENVCRYTDVGKKYESKILETNMNHMN